MYCKKTLSIILIFTSLASGIFAQEDSLEEDGKENNSQVAQTVLVSVEDAVAHALANSSTLKSADIDLEIKKRSGNNGWNVLLPNLSATVTMARASDDSVSSKLPSGVKMNESMHWSGITQLSASWVFSLGYIQQIRSAKCDYEAGKLSWEQAQRDTKVNVQKLFYALLLEQESLDIQRSSLENSRQRYLQAEKNYRNGSIPELKLLQTQVDYENAKPELSKAECDFKSRLDTFAFLIGYPVGTDIKLTGSISPTYIDVDYETLMANYSQNSLALQSLNKNIDIMKMNLSAMNFGTFVPSLAVNYTFSPMLTNFLDADKGGYPKGDWKDLNGAFSMSLAWNLTNLLPFSSSRQKAKDLKANIDKLELSKNDLIENQKISVRKAVDTLNDARAQIGKMDRSIALAQRSYEMTAKSYRNGTTELLDLNYAELQLNQAKLGLANQKFNYISALLDLETALNANLVINNTTETSSEKVGE